MEIEATNLRKDYKYLIIKSHFGRYLVEYDISRVPGHRSEIFATMQAAKRFCTMDIQNPRWGKEYPKLQWRAVANVL